MLYHRLAEKDRFVNGSPFRKTKTGGAEAPPAENILPDGGPVIFYPLVLPHEKMGSGSPFAMIRISLLIVLTAFLSTLERIDDTLLSAHMLEHPAVP